MRCKLGKTIISVRTVYHYAPPNYSSHQTFNDYFDEKEKYEELELPEKEKFFNKLSNKDISNDDYEHAIKVFKTFKCKNLLDYSILYLKTDICHLSDVFQKLSDFAYETYNLDPRHSYTLPGFSWQSMLMIDGDKKVVSKQSFTSFPKANSLQS